MAEPRGQRWDPDRYARDAGFVSAFGRPVVDLLAPVAGERILDLGCGDGALAEVLADAGAVVVGVDASAAQIAAARARLAGREAVEFHVIDGQRLAFSAEFDAVFSNAAMHWMRDAEAVLAGVFAALRPGGRFVAEMGGAGNVAGIVAALEMALDRRGLDGRAANPWFFPEPGDTRARLEAAGFVPRAIEHFARPTPIDTGLGDWLEIFAGSFLDAAPENDRAAIKAEVAAAVAGALRSADGRWTLDYVRLRFAADKPG